MVDNNQKNMRSRVDLFALPIVLFIAFFYWKFIQNMPSSGYGYAYRLDAIPAGTLMPIVLLLFYKLISKGHSAYTGEIPINKHLMYRYIIVILVLLYLSFGHLIHTE